jgi:ATP-dependent Lon protease
MLDEVDKVGADWRGDPSSALLEVLDPAQNHAFRDHYLDVEIDLSQVLFIATANVAETIPGPLLDRMEVIRFDGYTVAEKVAIARDYLWPRQRERNGLREDEVTVDDELLRTVVSEYTREAGVRQLERELGTLLRKVAEGLATTTKITPANLPKYLGAPKILPEEILKEDEVGIATGLAWTATGGDIMFIEARAMTGKGRLTRTGSLGEVMKESAQAALTHSRAKAQAYGIKEDFFATHDVHVHLPEGAIPNDGPSAGITMATAMLSVFTNRKVRRSVAMTGEITLRGKVLPIGGLKEKILAAKRAGITLIICPRLNKKELDDINPSIKRGLEIHLVDDLDEVLKLALIPPLEPRPVGEANPAKAFPAKPRTKPVTV